jgi:hypothetical protein
MNLRAILIAALSLLCLVGNAVAAQPITVEFEGPWIFVRVTKDNTKAKCGGAFTDCIVAISPSRGHKCAMFSGGMDTNTNFDPGVYFLKLQNPQPDNISGKMATFVPIPSGSSSELSTRLKTLVANSSNLKRYVVILPDAPFEKSFEEPPKVGTMEYSERAKITDKFVYPVAQSAANEYLYTKGVRIHYTVSSLGGTFSGTNNDGKPFFANETASFTFTVPPLDHAIYWCDLHARASFEEINDLFHPRPNYQPRKYVDFPDYGWGCRILDLQQFDGAVPPNDAVLQNVDSKESISISAVEKLIKSLPRVSIQLRVEDKKAEKGTGHKNAKENTINTLPEEVLEYLKSPSRDPNMGYELIGALSAVIDLLGDPTDKDKTKEEKKLILGLGTLRELVHIFNDTTGANCKAPMMNGNSGP